MEGQFRTTTLVDLYKQLNKSRGKTTVCETPKIIHAHILSKLIGRINSNAIRFVGRIANHRAPRPAWAYDYVTSFCDLYVLK